MRLSPKVGPAMAGPTGPIPPGLFLQISKMTGKMTKTFQQKTSLSQQLNTNPNTIPFFVLGTPNQSELAELASD